MQGRQKQNGMYKLSLKRKKKSKGPGILGRDGRGIQSPECVGAEGREGERGGRVDLPNSLVEKTVCMSDGSSGV